MTNASPVQPLICKTCRPQPRNPAHMGIRQDALATLVIWLDRDPPATVQEDRAFRQIVDLRNSKTHGAEAEVRDDADAALQATRLRRLSSNHNDIATSVSPLICKTCRPQPRNPAHTGMTDPTPAG